jgi:membrane associated rhomboid family serine protease
VALQKVLLRCRTIRIRNQSAKKQNWLLVRSASNRPLAIQKAQKIHKKRPVMIIKDNEKTFGSDSPDGFTAAVVAALIIPLVLGVCFRPLLSGFRTIIYLVFFLFPAFIFARILWEWIQEEQSLGVSFFRYIKPIPSDFFIYGNDLKKNGFPLVTVSIVLINSIIFIWLPGQWYEQLIFFPVEDFGGLHVFSTIVTCAFLHADLEHLFFNMVFLWIFGCALETKIGWKKYIGYYFAAVFGSNILAYVLLNIQAWYFDSQDIINNYHSLGASGAISGIMGLFVVRCFFARLKMSIPLIMIPFPSVALGLFSFPIRVQAPILVGFFFAIDLSGSVDQFNQQAGGVDYWAHVGGYLTCMTLGILMGLHREAGGDAIKAKAERLSLDELSKAEAEVSYQKILETEPENLEALNFIFTRQHKRGAKEAGPTFTQLLVATSKNDFMQVISLCREYLPRYLANVPSDLLARVGFHFFRNADLIRARYCLEWSAETEGPWQPKSMMMLAQTFAALENKNYAKQILEKVIAQFPGTMFVDEANRLMAEM